MRIRGALAALPCRAPGEEPGGNSLAHPLPGTSAGTPRRPGWGHSLAEEALGDGAQFSPAVLDQVHLLVHHHVVKLLPLLRNHDVGVPLHAQLQAYGGGTVSTQGAEGGRPAAPGSPPPSCPPECPPPRSSREHSLRVSHCFGHLPVTSHTTL